MERGSQSGHFQQGSCFIPVVRPARSVSFGDSGRRNCFPPRVTTCAMTRGDRNDKESNGADLKQTMEGVVREFRTIDYNEQRLHDSQLLVGSPLYESLYFKVGRRVRAGADQQAALHGNGGQRRGTLMLRRLREIHDERKREEQERQRAEVFQRVGHLLLSPLSLLGLMH